MTAFDKREEGFEKKFAHDEEIRFKAEARRNKRLSAWAVEKLGRTGQAAESYATELIAAALTSTGDDGIFLKLKHDFASAGVAVSDHQIRREMDELMHKALVDTQKTG